MFGQHIITGTDGTSLDSLVEQIWRAPIAAGMVRAITNAKPDNTWKTVERYWVLPTARSPRMLIPQAPRAATAGALLHYRGLRKPHLNLIRGVLGTQVKAGVPPTTSRLAVQLNRSVPTDSLPVTPLDTFGRKLGNNGISAAIGIRYGMNRKPTMQLFNQAGQPVGYAKMSWNRSSQQLVESEIEALNSIGPVKGTMRPPNVLATGTFHGYPYLITSPLAPDVRIISGEASAPTPQEMFSLCGVHRFGPLNSTEHFQQLRTRVSALISMDSVGLGPSVQLLIDRLACHNRVVPITSRWHGDLVPWNTARDKAGQLWCWDWENSEPDALAGLDPLHWMFSIRRNNGKSAAGNLMSALDDAVPYLHSVGATGSWRTVLAVYAVVVAERAWSLANDWGSWRDSWISTAELNDLLSRVAEQLPTSDLPD